MAHITFLGNFRFPWCSEEHFALTLEKLGHTVTRVQEDETPISSIVSQANSGDFFFWTRTYGFLQGDGFDMLAQIKVPTVSIHLDYYFGISRQMAMPADPFWKTDYVFQPDGDHQQEFETMGINSYWSPPAVYDAECNLFERPMVNDLIFVGSWREYHSEWQWRRDMVNKLYANYPNFKTFPTDRAIRGQELNNLYQETKVVAGDSLNLVGNKTYTSDRIFESTGRGAFILYPDIPFLMDIFPKEIFYKSEDFADLKSKIDYFIANDAEREDLRKACYEITKNNHTYVQRFEHILNVIGAKR